MEDKVIREKKNNSIQKAKQFIISENIRLEKIAKYCNLTVEEEINREQKA